MLTPQEECECGTEGHGSVGMVGWVGADGRGFFLTLMILHSCLFDWWKRGGEEEHGSALGQQ